MLKGLILPIIKLWTKNYVTLFQFALQFWKFVVCIYFIISKLIEWPNQTLDHRVSQSIQVPSIVYVVFVLIVCFIGKLFVIYFLGWRRLVSLRDQILNFLLQNTFFDVLIHIPWVILWTFIVLLYNSKFGNLFLLSRAMLNSLYLFQNFNLVSFSFGLLRKLHIYISDRLFNDQE